MRSAAAEDYEQEGKTIKLQLPLFLDKQSSFFSEESDQMLKMPATRKEHDLRRAQSYTGAAATEKIEAM